VLVAAHVAVVVDFNLVREGTKEALAQAPAW
jgi:hypothetical protein